MTTYICTLILNWYKTSRFLRLPLISFPGNKQTQYFDGATCVKCASNFRHRVDNLSPVFVEKQELNKIWKSFFIVRSYDCYCLRGEAKSDLQKNSFPEVKFLTFSIFLPLFAREKKELQVVLL
jgi:hypothetical protein